jgi:hypothetical protein
MADLAAAVFARYSAAQAAVDVGGTTVTRLALLGRLAEEPDPVVRRKLFLCLDPVWETIASDYSSLLAVHPVPWAVDANALGAGIPPSSVEDSLIAVLEAWRSLSPGTEIEPWDWWFASGSTARALRPSIPLSRIAAINAAYHASLGASLVDLSVEFDLEPGPEKAVAYTDFARRGPGRPVARVVAGYSDGGLGELTELIHETGHALHVSAVRTPPEFVDWPDSDAFTEAVADILALDTASPQWQKRWLGSCVPVEQSVRDRYAEVMLDICWALLEIRLHGSPGADASVVWADLTSTYLGIVAHPELPWWAMRGQLVQEPGYMVNYALGPIVAAELRSAIRADRGDWIDGDPGWYAYVSEHLLRFGSSRPAADVVLSFLGRPPTPAALIAALASEAEPF